VHVFYLHGFASSSRSSKAAFLADRLTPHGVALHAPDFNEPEFETLTITRMVDQVGAAIDALPPAPVVLIGSSMGGFVAVQVARTRQDVDRLVLLAPALEFSGQRMESLGDRGIADWRRTDRLEVFHYGFDRVMPIRYALYDDACGYNCMDADLRMPVQVFQGRRDTVVDPGTVERWARARSNVELHMLDDDHQLLASLPGIWTDIRRFLAL
jgi:hypothetical protein